ncbi:hypothetical protein F4678DRAFT_479105 [Xylaria arbuscula]|nr:hypothetical protein F4678DRAFT_479105 [Xylaria arbuscula]
MTSFPGASLTGWRRAGAVNVACLLVIGTILLALLIVSITRPGSSLNQAIVIYRMSRTRAAAVNATFHIIITLISTGIFASSNFFMQIVTAPSRKDILSSGKQVAWVALLLSSIPIHLLFSSYIFETRFQGADWHLTIATESFTQAYQFYLPGASLSPSATATSASYWHRLSAQECQAEYLACKPRQEYGDVVIVVESNISISKNGWTRSEVFNFQDGNLSSFWDPRIPPNNINPLWFSAQCSIRQRVYEMDMIILGCDSTCSLALGQTDTKIPVEYVAPASSTWQLAFQHSKLQLPLKYGYQDQYDILSVQFCLAEPLPGNYKVVLSNTLLLAVVVCVFLKVITCTAILWKLRHHSLVTPGDVIESFIMEPDHITAGLCHLDIFDYRSFHTQFPRALPDREDSELGKRLTQILPPVVWAQTSSYLSSMVILVALITGKGFLSNGKRFYPSALLHVNIPQILVSIYYYYYNAFFTHLQVEREWNEYSSKGKPLRVSYPKGQRTSSYRLQLPFRYSVPLILGSAVCHWIVSNALFGVNGPSFIAIGYSPAATLVLLVAACVSLPLPLLFCWHEIEGKMPNGGSNSLTKCPDRESNITQTNEEETPSDDGVGDLEGRLRKLTQSRLKWGTTPIPGHVKDIVHSEDTEGVLHLGFGDEATIGDEPEEGQRYV